MEPPGGILFGYQLREPTVCFFSWYLMWASLSAFILAGLVVAIVGLFTI